MSRLKFSIIIPAYNEANRIGKTLPLVDQFFAAKGEPYEIIVVDDGSRDQTAAVVKALEIKAVRVVNYGRNRGKGFAVHFGVSKAAGDWILFADADNSTPIEQFEKLYKEADKYQVVIGSRYRRGSHIAVRQGVPRIILSRLANVLIQALLLRGLRDTQCGFKLFSRSAAGKIFPLQTIFGWGFDMELLRIAREQGFSIKEVGITWYNDDQSRIQSSRVLTVTLRELFAIKRNSLRGMYRPNNRLSGANP